MANDKLSKLTPGQRLSAARAKAYEYMPYFRSGIQSLVPQDAEGLGTIGVTEGSVLMVDPEALGEMTAAEGGSVILHEYLHIYMNHAERRQKLIAAGLISDCQEDNEICNKAADAEINDNLVEAGCSLPKLGGKDMITPSSLGLKPNRTFEEYVYELVQKKDKNGGGGGGDSPGWGQCGSGAGNALPNEPPRSSPESRTETEQRLQRKQDSEQIRNAASSKSRGNVPGGLARFADADLRPAKIPWHDKLNRMVRAAVQHKLGQGDFTQTVRSRHQGALEWMFGDDAPVLPGEHTPLVEVTMFFDTSGSMDDRAMKKMCEEAQGIFRHMGGARMTMIAIDCVIHSQVKVGSAKEIMKNLKGGGGTDFRPAFEQIPNMKPRPNVAVFFTDGYGPAPEQPPPGVHTIWVILDGQSPCTWGDHIHVTVADVLEDSQAAA